MNSIAGSPVRSNEIPSHAAPGGVSLFRLYTLRLRHAVSRHLAIWHVYIDIMAHA
jgi:hypothetical protein